LQLACSGAALSAPAEAKSSFDYEKRFVSWYVLGWIENAYSLFCGLASGQTMTADGYVSLYQHIYWLDGSRYESWDFDIRTRYPDNTKLRAEIYVDGKLYSVYPEVIDVASGVASSSSDLCDDGLPGLCPAKTSAQIMRKLVEHLDGSKSLSFIFSDGNKQERHDIDVTDFKITRGAVARCISDLLVRLPRQHQCMRPHAGMVGTIGQWRIVGIALGRRSDLLVYRRIQPRSSVAPMPFLRPITTCWHCKDS
jgi:hypothetical protein